MRSPGDGRPLPGRNGDGPRSGGAPAHRIPSTQQVPPPAQQAPPTHQLPAESPSDAPRAGGSRVYGRERSGGSPIKPFTPKAEATPSGPKPPRRRIKGRTILKIVAAVVALLLVVAVGLFFWIDSRLTGIPGVLDDYSGRPADTPGTNWLLVGSDSRKGLSAADRKKLATGKAAGQRTDSMMLLHIPAGSDKPTLISLPRDSAVTIPGKGRNKLNAAYASAAPSCSPSTIENVTGVRIDNYMEIGFAGFVDIVDAVGGVEINVRAAVNDPKAGLKLKKGPSDSGPPGPRLRPYPQGRRAARLRAHQAAAPVPRRGREEGRQSQYADQPVHLDPAGHERHRRGRGRFEHGRDRHALARPGHGRQPGHHGRAVRRRRDSPAAARGQMGQ